MILYSPLDQLMAVVVSMLLMMLYYCSSSTLVLHSPCTFTAAGKAYAVSDIYSASDIRIASAMGTLPGDGMSGTLIRSRTGSNRSNGTGTFACSGTRAAVARTWFRAVLLVAWMGGWGDIYF